MRKRLCLLLLMITAAVSSSAQIYTKKCVSNHNGAIVEVARCRARMVTDLQTGHIVFTEDGHSCKFVILDEKVVSGKEDGLINTIPGSQSNWHIYAIVEEERFQEYPNLILEASKKFKDDEDVRLFSETNLASKIKILTHIVVRTALYGYYLTEYICLEDYDGTCRVYSNPIRSFLK